MISGAASGIGLASATRLAARGDVVGLIDRNENALAAATDSVRHGGGEVRALVANVLDFDPLARFCGSLADEFGVVTYMLSNAGVERRRPFSEMTVDDWELVLQTHVTGTFNMCRAVLPHMVAARAGGVLLMASDFAITGLREQANYTAAKTAIYSLAKALALEFAPAGIRVNAVGPGPIDTPLLRAGRSREDWETARDLIQARVPMDRLGRADEVAETVTFLLSDRSPFITGQLLQPNGGQVIW